MSGRAVGGPVYISRAAREIGRDRVDPSIAVPSRLDPCGVRWRSDADPMAVGTAVDSLARLLWGDDAGVSFRRCIEDVRKSSVADPTGRGADPMVMSRMARLARLADRAVGEGDLESAAARAMELASISLLAKRGRMARSWDVPDDLRDAVLEMAERAESAYRTWDCARVGVNLRLDLEDGRRLLGEMDALAPGAIIELKTGDHEPTGADLAQVIAYHSIGVAGARRWVRDVSELVVYEPRTGMAWTMDVYDPAVAEAENEVARSLIGPSWRRLGEPRRITPRRRR